MDEHRSNPFRRGPRGGSSPDRGPDRAKRGRGPARPEPEGAPKRGLRKLPADLRDLAEGRVDRLRSPRRAPEPLAEVEGSHVVPGVRNSEARAVYDLRVERLRAAAGRGDTEVLEVGLYDVQRLALWRARNVTDFDAFAEHVVGLGVERARKLAAAGAARSSGAAARAVLQPSAGSESGSGASERESGSASASASGSGASEHASGSGASERGPGSSVRGAQAGSGAEVREAEALSREFVALWLRSEAALIRICPTASVRVVSGRGGKPELELRMPADPVPTAVEAMRELGPALTGLAKLTSTEVPERAPRPRRP
jgi:hypothetical protein